jgi:hypothetical protein
VSRGQKIADAVGPTGGCLIGWPRLKTRLPGHLRRRSAPNELRGVPRLAENWHREGTGQQRLILLGQNPGQSDRGLCCCAAVEPDGLSLEAPSNPWKSSGQPCADLSDYGQPRNSSRVAAGRMRVPTHSGAMQQGACIAKIPQGPDISRGFVVN